MEHLFNFRTLLGLLVFVFWLIQKLASSRSNAAATREGKAPVRGAHGENLEAVRATQAAQAERVRRVREEAARQVAERRVQMLAAAPKRTEPPRQPQAPAEYESWKVERVAPTFAEATAGRPNALDVSPRTEPRNALGATRSTTLLEAAPATRPGAAWLDELRQAPTARRAILLTEILGPPVGLR